MRRRKHVLSTSKCTNLYDRVIRFAPDVSSEPSMPLMFSSVDIRQQGALENRSLKPRLNFS